MAQTSQEFPPWLEPSAVVITDVGGQPVTTSTTIVYIPPTYFGPSIPLGSLYIFGGTSEPATVVLPTPASQSITTTLGPPVPTSAIPSTTIPTTFATTTSFTSTSPSPSSASITSATPSSSLTAPITSATPTVSIPASSSSSLSSTSTSALSVSSSATISSISSSSSFSLPSGSTASPTTSSTSNSNPNAVNGLTKPQMVGVIVASVLGLIFFFVLALFLFLCLKGRRNRRQFTTLIPIDEDYYFIPPGTRVPGEGSPRHSGEEADPFLQHTSGRGWSAAAAAATGGAAMSQVSGGSPSRPPGSRVPPPPVATTGSNSSASTNSNASGFGVLIDGGSRLGYLPSMPEHPESGGMPLSDNDMARMDHENVIPQDVDQYEDEEYTGAYAYSRDPRVLPRLIDPTSASTPFLGDARPRFSPEPHHLSNKSSLQGDPDEAATLLTARRVRVEDLGPRSAVPSPTESPGLLGALGLGGLANLSRMSWFKNLDSPRHSLASPNYIADPLSEQDLETGRLMLGPDGRLVDSFGNRVRGGAFGTLPDGSRPLSSASGLSGNSGNTLYHDAYSSLPGTPLLAPLPRAVTPAEQPQVHNEHMWFSSPLANPPAYSDDLLIPSSPASIGSPIDVPSGMDILDTPAPAAMNKFSSLSSLKETPTGSSMSYKSPSFLPPGLDSIRPLGWSDTATDITAPGSFAGHSGGMGMEHDSAISIDVLEEAPPDAEQGWRTIGGGGGGTGGGFGDLPRRGTFGMFVHSPAFMSEQGSLHSMRSHFSPSLHSTGSAPASRRDVFGSISSNSSKPSAHSVARSMGSGISAAHSLLRTGSISSDDRKRAGRASPALSAFGVSPSSSAGGHRGPRFSPVIGSPPLVHMSPDKSGTIRSVGSGSTADDTVRANSSGLQAGRSTSPLSSTSFLMAPWAGGLDGDWQPAV